MPVGMGTYLSDSMNYREGAFRFGGQITYQALREHYYRDDIMYFLCRGLIEESVGKGFEVIDPETEEPLDWNEQLQEFLRKDMPEIVRALSLERRDGRAICTFMKKGTKSHVFRSYSHDFYKIEYDQYGDILNVETQSNILNYTLPITHTFSGKELESVYELLYRTREKINSGMSYIEPIWDIIIGLYFIASHIAYHVARAGAGVKMIEQEVEEGQPVDPLDEDAINDIIQRMANFGGAHDIGWLPPGVKINENLFNSGSNVRWQEIFDIMLTRITIYSSVPQSRLKGLVPGQLEGAEVNEESYFDVLRDIQELVKPFIKWYVMQIVEKYSLGSEEFDIRFNVREEMSEEDLITLDTKKVALAQGYISLGFVREKAIEKAGIEFESSELKSDEELMAEQQQNQFGDGSDGSSNFKKPNNNNNKQKVKA